MKDIALVIMAAGLGSRFGGGIKQLEPVGPNGELIIDYSINDALKAGFNKVVFVIRKDIEDDFKEIIGNRVSEKVKTEYVYQEIQNIPSKYCNKFPNRTKPWGTGQAVLSCKDFIDGDFLVINADDYYGFEAYQKAYDYLSSDNENKLCLISFILENTLSMNGGVTRGICNVNSNNNLIKIVETSDILKEGDKIVSQNGELDPKSIVSMNMWGMSSCYFEYLEDKFDDFLDDLSYDDLKSEFLLPIIVGHGLIDEELSVKVLHSKDLWFGMTYREDIDSIKEILSNR